MFFLNNITFITLLLLQILLLKTKNIVNFYVGLLSESSYLKKKLQLTISQPENIFLSADNYWKLMLIMKLITLLFLNLKFSKTNTKTKAF